MTTTDLDVVKPQTPAQTAETISQATAIEQARAVAEVQSAIVVAQQVPRDIGRALAEMRDSCGRMALASRAFYAVPSRGNGPSVHLARELMRIWGNVDYGVRELRRDEKGSEVQVYAWDQQANVRSTRSFINPHARMTAGKAKPLVDLNDIYLSNQNIGARAVRECIFTVLPTWFVEEAQDRCRTTLENGEGKSIEQRTSDMVDAFSKLGVTVGQIEKKLGRAKGSWTASDVANMAIAYTSITRDNIPLDEIFPDDVVTAAEIKASKATAAAPAQDGLIPEAGAAESCEVCGPLGEMGHDVSLHDELKIPVPA